MQNIQLLNEYGKSLVGKTAQSTLLTMINSNGKKVHEPAQKITDYEIVKSFGEHVLMVTIDGSSVFEDTLFNISK